MKLVFKTTANVLYLVRLPNYFDVSTTDELFDDIKCDLPTGEKIVEHHFYGDNMPTLEERKELDLHGKIISRPVELTLA